MTRASLWAFVISAFFACPAIAADESPQAFVQKFYDLYMPMTGWRDAIQSPAIRAFLEPGLVNALRLDAAEAKEADGLDSDPFCASQDPWPRYVAGPAAPTATGYRVKVYGIENGKQRAALSLAVDVTLRGGRWIITDFRYREGGDLLTELRVLRQERQKYARTEAGKGKRP